MKLKSFELLDIFAPLEVDPSLIYKRMFGGMAVYYGGLMMAVLTEEHAESSYRGKEYSFPIWYGILLCTSREHHLSLCNEFPELRQHPVLGKWLYLPMGDDEADFRSTGRKLIHCIFNLDPRFGIVPNKRSKKTRKIKKRKKGKKVKAARKRPKD